MPKKLEGARNRAAKAARELAELEAQAEVMRASLIRLQAEVVEAEIRVANGQTSQLVEANENLVLAALRAQTEAETATQAVEEMTRSASLDALTNLPNRVLLRDRFERAIASAKRRGTRLALLFLDLDDFKQINDTLGHAVGDEVLKMAAQRLSSSVRETDTVSRHAGDEFLILLADVTDASAAGGVAGKVIAALGVPSRIGEHLLRLKASIGISIYPDDGEDAQQLLNRADAAMYRAKRHGTGGFVFYGDESPGGPSPESPALAPWHRNLTYSEIAQEEQERRQVQLREASEQLAGAALRAQELRAATEQMERRQTEFLATLAREMLRNPAGTQLHHADTAETDSPGQAAAG